jgi:DNA-binding MarR family transcriptional regulator
MPILIDMDRVKPTGPKQPRTKRGGLSTAAPSGCSNMKLRRFTRLVSRHYDAHLAHCGLKTTQYSLLAAVAHSGPLQQGELARLLSLDASSLTRNLRPLVDAGLLSIDAGADGRSRQVSVTPAGLDLRAQARQHWKRAQLAFNDAIGMQRVAALHELIETCHQLLATVDEAEGTYRDR